MEVQLGLERRRILVLGGLKPPGHGDAGRIWAGGLSEAGAAWHVCRSEAKQCDSALGLPVLLCTHRAEHRALLASKPHCEKALCCRHRIDSRRLLLSWLCCWGI